MISIKHIVLGVSVLLICLIGYSLSSSSKAFACGSGGTVEFNRNAGCGWFHNNYAGSGGPLFSGGMGTTSTTDQLVSFIQGKCNNGGSDETAAAVIVMFSLGYSAPTTGGCSNSSMFNLWASSVKAYGSYGCNSGKCTGPNGSVNFYDSESYQCPERDTYLTDISGTYDVAPYWLTGSTAPPCGSAANDVIIFYDTNGNAIFFIRRDCGNILRDLGHLSPPPPPYNLTPKVTPTVNGKNQTTAFLGQTITFNYSVSDSGATSEKTNCTTYDNYFTGKHNVANPPDKGPAGANTVCTNRVFNVGTTGLGSFTVPANRMVSGDTICSSLYVNPGSRNSAGALGGAVGGEACVYILPPYSLTPTVTSLVNGAASSTAQVGQTVSFNLAVIDNGGDSQGTTCDTYYNYYVGYQTVSNPAAQGPAPANVICTNKVFTGNTTTAVGTFTVPAAKVIANETICVSLYVNPGSRDAYGNLGPAVGVESCVIVPVQPYVSVFGGDVSAGNGQPPPANGVCANNPAASIATWNMNSGTYNGAGTQFAAYALDYIYDFATTKSGSGASSGIPPYDLSFANNAATASNSYGGQFGSSMSCIPDYWATLSSANATNMTAQNITDLESGALAAGAYSVNGSLTLTGASVGTGPVQQQRIQVYVNGNLNIGGNITYQSSWTPTNMPLLEFIVNGNINISKNVTQLDGVYIAQGTGGASGTIVTCTDPNTYLAEPLNGSLLGNCGNKLVVNGSFVANWVELMRTNGTLSGSTGDNPNTLTSDAGEQFNFNPSLWIAQPLQNTSNAASDYDSIVSLPPIL